MLLGGTVIRWQARVYKLGPFTHVARVWRGNMLIGCVEASSPVMAMREARLQARERMRYSLAVWGLLPWDHPRAGEPLAKSEFSSYRRVRGAGGGPW